ncbi:MAG: hypothetical protein ABFS18_05200 [Thermodesulfobacteriota bacterium]
MKDLPISSRVAILVALVLTLAGILRQFTAGPAVGLRPGVVVSSEGDSGEKPVFPKAVLYPPVPAVLPELYEGYLFNSERIFEEVATGTTRGGNGAVDLAEVIYAGSLIAGEIYKGLITYQEKGPVARRAAKPARRGARTRKTAAKTVAKHKQLERGEKFSGYLVEKIEKDRIVFRKGDEVVEKFLYDPNKDRAAFSSAAKSKGAKSADAAQRTPVQRTVSRPERHVTRKTADATRRVMPSSGRRSSNQAAGRSTQAAGRSTQAAGRSTQAASRDTQPGAAELIKRRSERLLGLDPSLGLPRSPGIPGDPLRR